jgi:hypothetical protein
MKLSATLTTSLLLFSLESLSAPPHDEAYYSDRFCKEREGVSEVILEDLSRVDCLTEKYAVEADRAYKWAEAIGQSLLYANSTGKTPAVLIILYNDRNDCSYIKRLYKATENLNIRKFFTGDMTYEEAHARAAICLISDGM